MAWIMGPEYIIGSFIAFLVAFAFVWYLVRSERILHLFRIAALLFGGWIGALVGFFVVTSYDLLGWIVPITTVIGAWICDALMKRRGYRPFDW